MSTIDYTGIEYYIIGFIFSWIFFVVAGKYRQKSILHSNSTISSKSSPIVKPSTAFLFISFICLWIVPALRGHVGLDYDSYERAFKSIVDYKDIFNYEPGYCISILLIRYLKGDFQSLMFIYSMATGWLFWKSLYRDSWNVTLALFGIIAINYYFMPMSVIRQFMANAIVLMSIPYIERRNLIKFISILVLATSFHYTAIVFGVLYFVVPPSNSKKIFTFKGVTIICLLAIALWSLDSILGIVLPLITSVKSNYGSYFEENSLSRSIYILISVLPVVIFSIIYRNKLNASSPRNVIYIWMSILMIIMYILGMMVPAFSRIHYYFDFCIPVLFSYSTRIFKQPMKQFAYILICIYYIYMISKIFEYQYGDFLPYESVL